jgi:hypothetical protein
MKNREVKMGEREREDIYMDEATEIQFSNDIRQIRKNLEYLGLQDRDVTLHFCKDGNIFAHVQIQPNIFCNISIMNEGKKKMVEYDVM